MSNWKIIVPSEATNLFHDPSFDLTPVTTEWTVTAGDVFTRTPDYAKFGLYSARLSTLTLLWAWLYQTVNTAGGDMDLSVYARRNGGGVITNTELQALFDGDTREWDSITPVCDGWYRCRIVFNSGAFPLMGFNIEEDRMCLDGAMLIMADGAEHVYVDGWQPGCQWDGAPSVSTSTCSGVSRAGGTVADLEDDYGFQIGGMIGAGVAPLKVDVDEYALLPGGELNALRTTSREFSLTGLMQGTSLEDLHVNVRALIGVLDAESYPKDADGFQPLHLIYTGSDCDREIACYYRGGMEGSIVAADPCLWEKFAVKFEACNPYWYEVGDSAEVLDSNDTLTLRYCAGRLRSTGQWSNLGLAANPTLGGDIFAVAYNPVDHRIYFGGDFEGWGGVAGRDYIAAYDIATGTWSNVGGAGAVGSPVYAIAIGPEGDVYLGGVFINVGGANGDYVVKWDLSAGAWVALGAPDSGTVVEVDVLTFDKVGNLLAGGDFTNFAGVGADYFVLWDGANWSPVGAGGTGGVYAIAVDARNNYYVGGGFLDWAADPDADYWATWDGAAWSSVGGIALDNNVYTLRFDGNGLLYVGGVFTDAGGVANADQIFVWNGNSIVALGTGLNDSCYDIVVAPDGMVYAGGYFTVAGGLTLAQRAAKWNGSSWAHLDVDLPGDPTVYAICVCDQDPIVSTNYGVYLGFNTTGAGYFAGGAVAADDGSARAYPQFVVSRVGGTQAILEELRNETVGRELLFDYSLLDGETLTIDLHPTRKSIVSSFFGARPDAVIPNCDFGEWVLRAGDNIVTCFVSAAGAPTILAYLLWKDTYKSCD